MKWLTPLLFLLVLPVQADEGKKKKQDLEKDPVYHIKLAELYAGQKATLAKSLHHWEQAWQRAATLDRATQTRIVKAMMALRAALPNGKKPRKVNKWKVLGVVFRKVTWYEGDDDERQARYNVPDDILKSVEKSFHKSLNRVEAASRGHFKFERRFQKSSGNVQILTEDDGGFWMSPQNYDDTQGSLKWRPGQWDLVIVYVIGNDDPDNSIPFKDKYHVERDVNGAIYINFTFEKDFAKENGETGDRELRMLTKRIYEGLVQYGNYSSGMIPYPISQEIKKDPCYQGSDDRAEFAEHILTDHMTGGLWREASPAKSPKTEFIKEWLLSKKYDSDRGRGFDKDPYGIETKPIPETSRWKKYKSPDGFVYLGSHFGGDFERSGAYGFTWIIAKKETKVRLYLGDDDRTKVFLNGEMVMNNREWGGTQKDEHSAILTLKRGKNALLVKCENGDGSWNFIARIADLRGLPPAGVATTIGR